MHFGFFRFFSVVILLLYTGCGAEQTYEDAESVEYEHVGESWVTEIFKRDEMLSITLGQDLNTFIATYSPSVIEEGLQYTFEGRLSNGLPFSYYVTCDQGRIYEMSLDMYPEEGNVSELFEEIRIHFDSLYHKSRPTDGYATWKRASDTGRLVEVTLSDESLEMGHPTIMVNQLEYMDRDYED